MSATTTTPAARTRAGLLGGKSPLLRLQSDERLIAVLRGGNSAAFDVLFGRYRTRLLGFCRHMLASREDAEDVLQEVFAAAYNAILADEREINVRPWLYRIARNRCLNHLRRPTADGADTMDDQPYGHGVTAADIAHKRADVRHLLEDVQKLAESQRTALLLREIDALSYDQIAEAMETTIPSVKSLLVRARMSLAEAAEARQMSCDDVRQELAEVAEGLKKASPAVRRHVRECEMCGEFRTQLRKTTTAMAFAFPIGPLMILKKLALLKLGGAAVAGGAGGGAAAGGAAGVCSASGAGAAAGACATGAGVATGAGMATGAGVATGAGIGAVASKAVAGVAVTAILAGGAVEAKRVVTAPPERAAVTQSAKPAPKPAVNPTGGASLEGAPEKLVEPPPPAAAPAPAAEASPAPAGATGATGATGPTGPVPPEDGGAVAVPGDEPDPKLPVAGSGTGTQPESGGAAVPATGATGSEGATGVSGSSTPTGTTGTTGATGVTP